MSLADISKPKPLPCLQVKVGKARFKTNCAPCKELSLELLAAGVQWIERKLGKLLGEKFLEDVKNAEPTADSQEHPEELLFHLLGAGV